MASTRLVLNAKELRRRLKQDGFEQIRKKGSHEQWRCEASQRFVTLSVHGKEVRGEEVRDIYRQAGWSWRAKERKKMNRTTLASASQPSADSPPLSINFSEDEKIDAVVWAQKEGIPAALSKFKISRHRLEGWANDLGENLENKSHIKILETHSHSLKKEAPVHSQTTTSLQEQTVKKIAEEILAGERGSRVAKKFKFSVGRVYDIAHGNHKLLNKDLAAKLKYKWDTEHPESTLQHRSTNMSTAIATKLLDEIAKGKNIQDSAKKIGISYASAGRIWSGKHPVVTSALRARIEELKKQQNNKKHKKEITIFPEEKRITPSSTKQAPIEQAPISSWKQISEENLGLRLALANQEIHRLRLALRNSLKIIEDLTQ